VSAPRPSALPAIARAPIFYGWWNVLTGFFGMALSYAMFTVFAFGVFVRPLEAQFGWSRGEMSFALTVTNITVVVASPCLGLLIDRLGVRRILVPSVIAMGLAVLSMAALSASIWHFYAMYLLIPLLGAGTLPQSYSRVVIAWFVRRRGIALGICLSGFGVGAALVPAVAQWIIDLHDWRTAYLVFAAAVFLILLPLAVFVLREHPREMGLEADGRPLAPVAEADALTDPAAGLSGPEAARTVSYWLILISFLLIGVGITSVLAHLVPMLIDRGLDPRLAALSMTLLGLGLILGRVLSGYLMDLFFAPYVAVVFLCGLFAGIAILAAGIAGPWVFVAAVLVGLATGAEISETGYICSRYFGQKAFGTIYGIMFAAFQLGSAFGAPFMGLYYDRAGDYSGALWFAAALVAVGAVLIACLGPYPDLRRHRPA